MKLRVDKIASVACRLGFAKEVEVSTEIECQAGTTIVVRALRQKRVYREIELSNGRMSTIVKGDVILGALGRRRALRGFSGDVPESLKAGDTVEILNRGGVIGRSHGEHKDYGKPLSCEVLGAPVRDGRPVRLSDAAIPRVASLAGLRVPPLVIVSGSGMEVGKTLVVSELVQDFARSGRAVAGGKLTGIACLRDLIALEDHGARATASFLDAGFPSTVGLGVETTVEVAKTVIAHLSGSSPEVIFLELGDGILGEYGVLPILLDSEIRAAVRAHVFCAADLVAAWGGCQLLRARGVAVDLVSGPVTDNRFAAAYVERELGTKAINAYGEPQRLAEFVRELLVARARGAAGGGA